MTSARAIQPILAASKTAAMMLDMREREFLSLVAKGALPGPVRVGEVQRWRVDDLRAIGDGTAARTGLIEDME